MKKHTIVVLSLVSGLLLSGAAAGSAFADASQSYYKSGIERSNASYVSSNNKLRVYDSYSDGYGGRSYWRTSNGDSGHLDNSNGAGSAPTVADIPGSSGTMYFKACIKNGGVDAGCNTTDASTSL